MNNVPGGISSASATDPQPRQRRVDGKTRRQFRAGIAVHRGHNPPALQPEAN